jgi:hypothetical protein
MPEDELAALAEQVGTAVVESVNSQSWFSLRSSLADWFGRGDAGSARAQIGSLNQSRAWLRSVETARRQTARERTRWQWANRVREHLDGLGAEERTAAVTELRALLAGLAGPGTAQPPAAWAKAADTAPPGPPAAGAHVRAEGGAVAVGRDLTVTASGERSVAAAVIRGDVHAGSPPGPFPPPVPDASQG